MSPGSEGVVRNPSRIPIGLDVRCGATVHGRCVSEREVVSGDGVKKTGAVDGGKGLDARHWRCGMRRKDVRIGQRVFGELGLEMRSGAFGALMLYQ